MRLVMISILLSSAKELRLLPVGLPLSQYQIGPSPSHGTVFTLSGAFTKSGADGSSFYAHFVKGA